MMLLADIDALRHAAPTRDDSAADMALFIRWLRDADKMRLLSARCFLSPDLPPPPPLPVDFRRCRRYAADGAAPLSPCHPTACSLSI